MNSRHQSNLSLQNFIVSFVNLHVLPHPNPRVPRPPVLLERHPSLHGWSLSVKQNISRVFFFSIHSDHNNTHTENILVTLKQECFFIILVNFTFDLKITQYLQEKKNKKMTKPSLNRLSFYGLNTNTGWRADAFI